MTRRLIASVLFALIVPIIWWLGGYDFNERGLTAVMAFVGTVFCGVWMYFAPWWEE